jgi:hypothetical protein
MTRQRGTNGHAYQELIEPSAQRANGRASYVRGRPAWSIQDLGQAAAGVPRLPFLAACYSYAGDRSVYWELWAGLLRAAQELRVRNGWPAQVRGPAGGPAHFYLEQLAQLVLDEDAHQHLFHAAPVLYPIYVSVDEQTWHRSVFHRFDKLRLRFQGWIAEAMAIVQARLDEIAADGE